MKKLFTYIFFFIIFGSELFAVNFPSTNFAGTNYVYLKDIAKYYGMSLKQDSKNCYLYNKQNSIKFEFPTKSAEINSVQVSLSFPSEYNNGNSMISAKDFQLLLQSIINNAVKKQKIRTIIIDPGHGGKDNGTQGSFSKEKDVALSIARKVASLLSRYKYKVIMTRNSDKYIDLDSRAAVSSRYNADLFISIHCNSANSSIDGIETFILSPVGSSSTYCKSIENEKFPGNAFDQNNAKLGYEIQKSLKKANREDRGLKHARFKVLKEATTPAVLIELGFLSNKYEERLLNSQNYQDALAGYIVAGIIAYSKDVGY